MRLRRTEHTAALTWRTPKSPAWTIGVWPTAMVQAMCEKNAESEGVGSGVRSGTGMPTSWISLMRVSTPW